LLPLQQAIEIKSSITEYFRATFDFKEKNLYNAFFDFIEDPDDGVFKGPYISLKLPFVTESANTAIPLEIKPVYPPYKHQLTAFCRLTTENNTPKPTLLTTGTGSGKTECFMYPVLDYCYKNRAKKGIKTIILYPMNALATDQAGRLADAIWSDERLRGKITAGLFIGLGEDKKDYPTIMGEKNIIENRTTILDTPPDILLTNFKMLDYALLRSGFCKLWENNLKSEHEQVLKFIVLDELHTYDGAKATDVANLIRRLKLKLKIDKNQLCPVGTSATIGNQADSKLKLCEYAAKVFGEDFDESAVIGESRKSIAEFFPEEPAVNYMPTAFLVDKYILSGDDNYQTYLKKQLELWGMDPELACDQLGDELKKYKIVRDIIEITAKETVSLSQLIRDLAKQNGDFRKLEESSSEESIWGLKAAVLSSILALIAHAKIKNGIRNFPFLYLQVQIWVRELSGVFRVFDNIPRFVWQEELDFNSGLNGFPVFFCRECQSSGFLIAKADTSEVLEKDPKAIYDNYFSNHKDIYFANIKTENNLPAEEYSPTDKLESCIDKDSLELYDNLNENRLPIVAYRKINLEKQYSEHYCPYCNSRNSMSILGTKVATLSSITAGQILSSNLDPQPEKGRKLLIFSNGVQDAAHHAGFIQARNYRFAFRTALQQVINSIFKRGKSDLTLDELRQNFIEHWKTHTDPTASDKLKAYFFKFFPSDCLGRLEIKDGSSSDKKFVENFDNRVSWELFSEFGYNSIIGRTLEKTGSSVPYHKIGDLKQIYQIIKPWLEAETLLSVTEEQFIQLTYGFLHRLRTRGGIAHPFLDKFRTDKSNYFLIHHRANPEHPFIHSFGKSTRLPKLISATRNTNSDIFDRCNTAGQTDWYSRYYKKSLILARADIAADFYSKLVELLTNYGILDKKTNANRDDNYALNPQKLYISKEPVLLECSECGHKMTVALEVKESVIGTRCLSYRCDSGVYREAAVSSRKFSYYRQVYSRQYSPRIYAAEHTGILTRKVREEREKSFKLRPAYDSLNALIATSTLEMGIDIGDLTSTVNADIPPQPANFLQRVGRAGRSVGSALIVNFARKKSHDQYYFADPMQMMSGEVNTPGCYLEAKEILKRHFMAFCFDSWATNNPAANHIPDNFKIIKLENSDLADNNFFINRLIAFSLNIISANSKYSNLLLSDFATHYDIGIEPVLLEIKKELLNGAFFNRLLDVFSELQLELQELSKQAKTVEALLKKYGETDPKHKELKDEIRNLNAAKNNIKNRSILEHLTNCGILPNYAFPETGVTLSAAVKKIGAEHKVEEIEVVRPAGSAIKELIPGNSFYTQGYKLKISGMTVNNWNKDIIVYRFCSACDHLEIDQSQNTVCPKCGDDSFKSAVNKIKLYKLANVRSFTREEDGGVLIDDKSDERERFFTALDPHFIFHDDTNGVWAITDHSFGIEYERTVDIYTINLGSKGVNGAKFIINQKEASEYGFVVCKSCGKTIQPGMTDILTDPHHFPYCQHRDEEFNATNSKLFETLFPYRRIRTEAIKIILPVSDFDYSQTMAIFKAGISIGLKNYYAGSPDHIAVTTYSEHNKRTGKDDRYLVLYDTIPGGTGYLEKIFNKGAFIKIIEAAYQKISSCKCEDGCYKCIYSYANQYERGALSRLSAEKYFKELNDAKGLWEQFTDSLSAISNTGRLEESELELRFVAILSKYAKKSGGSFKENKIDGFVQYEMTLVKESVIFTYEIKPQEKLGPAKGVSSYTKPDFVLYCTNITKDGAILDSDSIKPIAVYLDGYQFHASEDNFRFDGDLIKRRAVIRSNCYWCFTFTWDDLQNFESEKKPPDFVYNAVHASQNIYNTFSKHLEMAKLDKRFKDLSNSVERFLYALLNFENRDSCNLPARLLFGLQSQAAGIILNENHTLDFISDSSKPINFYPQYKDKAANAYIDKVAKFKDIDIRLFFNLQTLSPHLEIFYESDTIDKMEWQNFWNLFNLLQFCLVGQSKTGESVKVVSKENIEDIFANFPEEYHQLVKELLDQQIDFNKDDTFVLTDASGAILAEADLGFGEQKIVIGVFEGCEKYFVANGYKVYALADFSIQLLKEGK